MQSDLAYDITIWAVIGTWVVFFIIFLRPIKGIWLFNKRWKPLVLALISTVILTNVADDVMTIEKRVELEQAETIRQSLAREKNKTNRMQEEEVIPEHELELTFNSRKGGFGTVAFISGSIKSTSKVPLKDIELLCSSVAPSGSKLGEERVTIYEKIAPGGKISFQDIDAGYLDQQSVGMNCKIVGAIIVN